jgi:hypothetical protein
MALGLSNFYAELPRNFRPSKDEGWPCLASLAPLDGGKHRRSGAIHVNAPLTGPESDVQRSRERHLIIIVSGNDGFKLATAMRPTVPL